MRVQSRQVVHIEELTWRNMGWLWLACWLACLLAGWLTGRGTGEGGGRDARHPLCLWVSLILALSLSDLWLSLSFITLPAAQNGTQKHTHYCYTGLARAINKLQAGQRWVSIIFLSFLFFACHLFFFLFPFISFFFTTHTSLPSTIPFAHSSSSSHFSLLFFTLPLSSSILQHYHPHTYPITLIQYGTRKKNSYSLTCTHKPPTATLPLSLTL